MNDGFCRSTKRKRGRRRKKLDLASLRAMIRVRQARRAYRNYHTRCLWSFDPEYRVTASDVGWVAEQLRKNGGWDAWALAAKLDR
jgi:hypothetical protein